LLSRCIEHGSSHLSLPILSHISSCRNFYGCSKWRPSGAGAQCKFFQWADVATPNHASPRRVGSGNGNHGATPSPQNQNRRAPTTADRPRTAAEQAFYRPLKTPHARFECADGPVYITLKRMDDGSVGFIFRYHELLKEFIKGLRYPMNTRWEPSKKAWTFSFQYYKHALRKIQNEYPPKNAYIDVVASDSDLIDAFMEFEVNPEDELLDDSRQSQRCSEECDRSASHCSSLKEEEEEEDNSPPLPSARNRSLHQKRKLFQNTEEQAKKQQKRACNGQQQVAAAATTPPSSSSAAAALPQPSFPATSQSECDRRIRSIQTIWPRLYEFQREAVQFGLWRGGRVLLGDDMGLGKTVQALALAACYKEDWPLLIVSPSSMKLVWEEAIRAWLPSELQPAKESLLVVKDGKTAVDKMQALCGDKNNTGAGKSSISQSPRIVIVSYDMVKRLLSPLRTLCPHVIIADESHHLKSYKAQRTQSFETLAKESRRLILISGTPVLSRPFELYPQLSMLRPELFGTLHEFGMQYCDGKPALNFRFASSSNGYDYKGSSNESELRSRLEKDILIRREKSSVLRELPAKIRKRIPIESAPASRGVIDAVKKQLATLEGDVESGRLQPDAADFERKRLVTEFFRVTGPAKVPEAVLHIQSILDAGQKVLIFAHHKEVLDALQRDLKFSNHLDGFSGEVIDLVEQEEDEQGAGPSKGRKRNSTQTNPIKSKKNAASTAVGDGIGVTTPAALGRKRKTASVSAAPTTAAAGCGCVRIDGSVNELRRKAAVDAFQTDPAVRAALLSIQAAGVGLTLTAATVVIFVELWWNPGSLIQAEDRAHRVGQRAALEVHYLTAAGTADDLMWRTVQEKLGVVSSVVGGGNRRHSGNAITEPRGGSRITPENLFRDINYAERYKNVQQRLAEEAERGGTGGAMKARDGTTAAAGNGGAGSVVPSISEASTVANSGANYAEVFEQQQQQQENDSARSEEESEEEESAMETSEEEESGWVSGEYVPNRRCNRRRTL